MGWFTAQSVKYELVNIQKDKTSNREIGEIKIQKFSFPYYKNKELTDKCFSNNWFLTGDIGYIENEKLFLLEEKMDK